MDSALSEKLKQKIVSARLPEDIQERLLEETSRIELLLKNNSFTPEVDRQVTYVNFASELPWSKTSQDILDITRAKQILDKNHYGLEDVKKRILEYLSILILNKQKGTIAHSNVLAFVGLVGSGKTSIAYSIAQSLGRPVVRIPFGGLGSAAQLRGESRIKADAEAGLIIKSIKRAGVKNPVILLDELDRITDSGVSDVMGVLVELLDPEQNMSFLDHYLDIPFDLSQCLFVATANNTGKIATAVLDRLELIEMPFYSDDQKIVIGRDYIMPTAIKEAGLSDISISIDPALWGEIVRPLGFDGGIRSLKRNIDSVIRKIAMTVVEGNKGPYTINQANIKEYIN